MNPAVSDEKPQVQSRGGKATQEVEELGLNSMGSEEAECLVPGRGPQYQPDLFALASESANRVGVVAPPGNKGSSLPSSLPPHIVWQTGFQFQSGGDRGVYLSLRWAKPIPPPPESDA